MKNQENQENQEKQTTRSLKEVIWELYEFSHEDSFEVKKRIIPELIEEVNSAVEIASDLEYVDFMRLQHASALLQRSVAIWATDIQKILNLVKNKVDHKKMLSAHKGVFSISCRFFFANILLDRYTTFERFELGGFQIVVSKNSQLLEESQKSETGVWYKITENQACRHSPRCNEEGIFQRHDGGFAIRIEVTRMG